MPALWQSLYQLQPHLRFDQAWSNNAHVIFTAEAKSALRQWAHVLQAPPSRRIYLFSRHKGFWSGKAYAKPYALPPEFNPEVHKFVPGEDKASPIAHMAIDACPVSYGAGGYSGEERFSGKFPDDLMHMHINFKELKAIFYGVLKGAGNWWQNCRLLVRSDNMTAVSCVNRGSHFLHHLDAVIMDILAVCKKYKIEIRAQHIAGIANWLADRMSRLRLEAYTSDWLLVKPEFLRWNRKYGPYDVDGMADPAGNNAQVSVWWSAMDDFLVQPLKGLNVWLNVAFNLAGPALAHIVAQRREHGSQSVRATVIVPYRPDLPWWYLYARRAILAHIYKKGERLFSAAMASSQTEHAPRTLCGNCPFDVAVLRFE